MSKGFKISMGILGLFILVFIILGIITTNEEQTITLQKQAEKETNHDILKYRVVKKQDYSYLNTPRMAYRITLDVEKLPLKEQMEKIAIRIWKNGNKNWKEFTVFMYLPDMDTESAAWYVAEFSSSELKKSERQDFALYGTRWQQEKTQIQESEIDSKDVTGMAREYFIDLDIVKLDSRKIKIDIATNFPDGTNLFVDVSRTYQEKGKSETYSGEMFNKDIAVKNGKIQVESIINDSIWYNKYYEDAKKFGHLMEYPGVGKVSANVGVWVLFSPRRDQRSNILKILGKNGEFIKGSGATKGSAYTSFEVTKLLEIPFKK